MIVDTHTHSYPWSVDGIQTVPELLKAVNKQGLSGVAVTDHYDFNSAAEDGRTWTYDIDAFCRENARYRKRPSLFSPGEPPGILHGIEISFCREHMEEIQQLTNHEKLDCIILSVHDYKGTDPAIDGIRLSEDSLQEYYKQIIDEITFSMQSLPQANICGHYDFFSRYVQVKNPKMKYSGLEEAFDRLFHVLIQNQQALEINTGTIAAMIRRYGMSLEEAMPDPEIINRYCGLGGQLITLASDAHRTEDCARYFRETLSWLKRQGIDRLYWMEERKWYSDPFA